MPWTYIVECRDGSYYVGSTVDLDRRLWEHNHDPAGAAYTRRRRPVRLVWAADYASITEAFAFEKQVQGWSRKKREALIRGDFEGLPALAGRRTSSTDRRLLRSGGFETGASAPSSTTEPVVEEGRSPVSKPPHHPHDAGGFETGARAPSSTTEPTGGFATGASAPSSTTEPGNR